MSRKFEFRGYQKKKLLKLKIQNEGKRYVNIHMKLIAKINEIHTYNSPHIPKIRG
jgi:hypothetical protein